MKIGRITRFKEYRPFSTKENYNYDLNYRLNQLEISRTLINEILNNETNFAADSFAVNFS